ncbi:MAG: GTPase HflX [Alphaproteobacteria bacterium]|nr:GTPase HflX [Alphaproteobacteria bacterium]
MNKKNGILVKAFVIHPALRNSKKRYSEEERGTVSCLEEAVGLAKAIDLDIVYSKISLLTKIRPATYLGKGEIEELEVYMAEEDAELLIMDCQLSPVQQRNLEKELKVKVIDRTALILEIFGERAVTKEGTIQVELAHLTWQRSRLVRSWTHLERQRGGAGFLGGPGERQIELDRRIIGDKITKLKKELERVKRTRELHRKSRRKVPYPIVALVGYTNAGKSTLFNLLTEAKVYAEDQLFATLDPTMRKITLPSGKDVIVSDTVGFISNLPTELIAAFRATLEEVLEADVILHVRDISSEDTAAQKNDVESVLKSLGVEDKMHFSMIEVFNKSDLLDEEQLEIMQTKANRYEKTNLISAMSGDGVDSLLTRIEDLLSALNIKMSVSIDVSYGAMLSWLYDNAEVLSCVTEGDKINVDINISQENASKLRAKAQKDNRCLIK